MIYQDFIPSLYQHLVRRILGPEAEPEHGWSHEHTLGLQILEERIYQHHTLRVNYTTYDMRREQDTINPERTSDVGGSGYQPSVAGRRENAIPDFPRRRRSSWQSVRTVLSRGYV